MTMLNNRKRRNPVLTRWLTANLFVASFLCSAGCESKPQLASVGGRVTINGQAVTRGKVTFVPNVEAGTEGKAAVGEIQADGTYQLQTFDPGDGAIVGRHQVAISGQGIDDDEYQPPNPQIDPRYGHPRASGLSAEVKPGRNELHFQLDPPSRSR